MNCKKCGNLLDETSTVCEKCGEVILKNDDTSLNVENKTFDIVTPLVNTDTVTNVENKSVITFKDQIQMLLNNKKFVSIVGILLLILVAWRGIDYLNKEDRTETLITLKEKDNLKFTIDGNDYYLGEKISSLKKNKLIYENGYVESNDYILSDSITVYPFYYEDTPVFLGALYCSSEENCKYDDAVLIKANFYQNSNVLIDDFLRIGLTNEEVKEKYGKEDGEFYQDESFLVWTFGEEGKIGNPYYLVKFNSNERVEEIRIGVWWYEDEYEYTLD